MLIILAIFLTTALANSQEKYIDLLPEEDKEEFLNTVARRIFKTVESTENADKSSRELTEEDLKGHNKFVQDILKEESERMSKRRADDSNSDDEKKTSENLEVKPLSLEITENDNSDKIDKSSDTKDTHLSANIKRRSIDDTIQESSTDYIKVEIVTENIMPMQKRYVNTDGESNEPENDLRNKTSQEEEMIITELNTLGTPTLNFKMQTEEPKYLESTTEFKDLRVEETNYNTSTTYENETEYKVPVKSDDENNSNSNDESESKSTEAIPSIENNNSYTLNSTIPGSLYQNTTNDLETENKSAINSSYVEAISATTDEYLEEYSTANPPANNTLTSSLTDEGTTDIFIDLSSYLTTTESATLNKYSANAFKSNMATTVNYGEVSENKTPKIAIKIRALTTTGTPVLIPANFEVKTTKKPKKIIKLKKNSENTTFITYFASNALKKSKSEYDLKKAKPNFNKKYEEHANLRPYQVYEIPWPDSTEDKPFLRNPESIQEQLNYVPVYKYSPNYAYYNPNNRRGPNAVEENSIELETNLLREGKIKGKKPEANEFILQLNDELRKFGVYKKKQNEYAAETAGSTTPANQGSSEEGDTVMHLPDSDEKLHPINSMKNGLKTHIRAVRDILYKKQVYNYTPVKKKEYIKHLYGNTDILEKYPYTIDDDEKPSHALRAHYVRDRNIDIDYYFGRMQRLNDKTKGLHRLQGQNSPETHDMNELLMMNYARQKLNDDHEIHPKKGLRKNEHSNFSTIAKILSVTDEKDVFVNLDKLQQLNLKLRRNEDVKVGIYIKVLKDLIEQDSKALKQYDWLATTVQIQSALEKLFKLILQKKNYKPIHPADIQILKYAIFIHNFALELRGANQVKTELRKQVHLLPRNKKKKKNKVLKEKGLLNRVWLYLRTLLPDLGADDGLNNLNEFLLDVENALYDLHEAITNIAKVTKFKQQNWFDNIKDIYFTSDEKHLRGLLLHISFSRLIDLIENSCENGLENDFIQYMKTHKKESKRTLEEMLFVLKILDEIKHNLE